MIGRWLPCTALAATLALASSAAPGAAAPQTTPSEFALAIVDIDIAPTLAIAATGGVSDVTQEFLAGPQLAAVRYRPRRSAPPLPPSSGPPPSHGAPVSRGPGRLIQIHGGAFDPELASASGVLLGFRAGPQFDDRVALGFGADWRFKEENTSIVISEEPIPGGGTREVRRELSRAHSHWIPMQAHLQLSPFGKALGIIPYVGVAGGYQILLLSADDYATGEAFDATFGGWGWQAYGGVALPIGGPVRLTGEVFANDARVSRDFVDVVTGEVFREDVDLDGVGARAGLSWGW